MYSGLQDDGSESSQLSLEILPSRQNLPDVLPHQQHHHSPHVRILLNKVIHEKISAGVSEIQLQNL